MRRFCIPQMALLSMLALFALFFISCGDDDDDDERPDVYVPPDDDDLNDDLDDDSTNDDVNDDANDDSTDDDVNDDTDDDADDDADDDTDDDVDDDVDDDTGDDDVDITWILIPAGEFMMGCSPDDDMCIDTEKPSHRVILTKDFFMTETEITQEQYEMVIGDNPSYPGGCPDCAVNTVTWDEVNAFCEAIDGRLPTEAEWEYAARAGTTTRFYCGDDWDCLDDIAWYSDYLDELDRAQLVRQKQPNAFGLYDMLGNVSELVSDEWNPDYYQNRPDPDIDPQGPPHNEDGVCTKRGGCWRFAFIEHLRSSSRVGVFEIHSVPTGGIRCARDK